MSKFLGKLKDNVKKIPGLIKRLQIKVDIVGDFLEISLTSLTQSKQLKEYLRDLVIKIARVKIFDVNEFPEDYDIRFNGIVYPNRYLSQVENKILKIGDKIDLICHNRIDASVGRYEFEIFTRSTGRTAKFPIDIAPFARTISKKKSLPEAPSQTPQQIKICGYCGKQSSDPNQRICENCGNDLI